MTLGHRLRGFGKGLLWCIAALALISLFGWLLLPNQVAFEKFADRVSAWSAWFLVFRLVLIGTAWIQWERFWGWYFDGEKPEAQTSVVSRRNFYIGFLVAIELFLVQNVLGRSLNWFLS